MLFLNVFYTADHRWAAYVIFLIIVGGLLVVFSYVSSLIPNELFIFKKINRRLIYSLSIFLIAACSLIFILEQNFSVKINNLNIFGLFHFQKIILIILVYLLIALCVVVFFTNSFKYTFKNKITYDFFAQNTPHSKNSKQLHNRLASTKQFIPLLKFRILIRVMLSYSNSNRYLSRYTLFRRY